MDIEWRRTAKRELYIVQRAPKRWPRAAATRSTTTRSRVRRGPHRGRAVGEKIATGRPGHLSTDELDTSARRDSGGRNHHADWQPVMKTAARSSQSRRRTCHAAIVRASLACGGRRNGDGLQDSDRRDGDLSCAKRCRRSTRRRSLRNSTIDLSHLPKPKTEIMSIWAIRLAFRTAELPAPRRPGADGVHHPGAYWIHPMALAELAKSVGEARATVARATRAIRIQRTSSSTALGRVGRCGGLLSAPGGHPLSTLRPTSTRPDRRRGFEPKKTIRCWFRGRRATTSAYAAGFALECALARVRERWPDNLSHGASYAARKSAR